MAKKANPNVKVLLALGGWTDSGSDKYSKLVSNSNAISNFAKKAVEKLTEHKFDGLSLEWQYPVCWQADCRRGKSSEKQGFVTLSKVLTHKNELIKRKFIWIRVSSKSRVNKSISNFYRL